MIDSSIALQGRPMTQLLNPLELAGQTMQLQKINQTNQANEKELQDQKTLRDILKRNTVTDENGNAAVNKGAALSEIYKYDPTKGLEFDKSWQADNLNKLKQQSEAAGQLIARMTPDNIPDIKKQAHDMSVPGFDKIPDYMSPDAINKLQVAHMSLKEQFDKQHGDRDLNIKQQEADAKTKEVNNKDRQFDLELKKLYGGAAPAGAQNETDPAKLVPFMVPQHHQAKAFGEIEAAQNTKANAADILNAFDNAAKGKNLVDVVPGMLNADQKSYHALLGPTFKDVEGTVRQAAMDNMYINTTPQSFDSEETKKKKRDALVSYLAAKSSAPTAMGYGIDLSKFQTTRATKADQGREARQQKSEAKKPDWAL